MEGSIIRRTAEMRFAGKLPRFACSRQLLAEHSAKAALAELDQAPKAQQNELAWIAARNWALWSLGNQAELSKGVQQGLALGRTPDLLLQSAVLKVQVKDYKGARIALQEGMQRSPEDSRLFSAMGSTYVLEGQPALGTKQLREHAGKWPHSARVQLHWGQWLLKAGDAPGAREAFLAAKAADPKFTEADLQLAEMDANAGKLDEARKRFIALSGRAEYKLTSELWLANIEDRAQNYPLAIERYRRVLAMESRNIVALNNLAYLLANQPGQSDEALKYAQQARELEPTNADVEGTLGWVLYRKGLYDNALHYLRDASQKDSADTSGAVLRKYHLGMAYWKTGDRGAAMKLLNSAMKTDATVPEAAMARQLLLETR